MWYCLLFTFHFIAPFASVLSVDIDSKCSPVQSQTLSISMTHSTSSISSWPELPIIQDETRSSVNRKSAPLPRFTKKLISLKIVEKDKKAICAVPNYLEKGSKTIDPSFHPSVAPFPNAPVSCLTRGPVFSHCMFLLLPFSLSSWVYMYMRYAVDK